MKISLDLRMEKGYQIIDITDHSLFIFRLESWQSWLLIISLAFCGLVSIGGTLMIINYIKRFAPKDRPINTMVFVDQVSTVEISTPLGLSFRFLEFFLSSPLLLRNRSF
jgi:hypothetical protein